MVYSSTFRKLRSWHLSPITSWQIDGETLETVTDFIFLGSKITADGDCSHEIKRHLLLGIKVMTNLDNILKGRDFANKGPSSQGYGFSRQEYWSGVPLPSPRWTFVGKVMSLLFNMLSRLGIAVIPRSKHLLISWLQSPSAVILEPPKIKSLTVSIVSSSICHEVIGLDTMILVF